MAPDSCQLNYDSVEVNVSVGRVYIVCIRLHDVTYKKLGVMKYFI